MKPGQTNSLLDVAGLSVGQSQDDKLKSGVTVIVGDTSFVAGVHVMGGAPGTRETDLLAPNATVAGVDALVLAGGSAFGLGAADGVAEALRKDGRGFEVADHRVPIVSAAILFDLANGGDKNWSTSPYPELGRVAYTKRGSPIELGSVGAGTGATVADLKGGLGTASCVLPSGAVVAALVAVNALGQVTVGDGPEFWAAPFENGSEFGGLGLSQRKNPPIQTKLNGDHNTTLAVVATDLTLEKATATRMAIAAHDGMARAIVPAHTPMDGDLVFSAATGRRAPEGSDVILLGHAAALCLARAIARGVFAATSSKTDKLPTWQKRFGDASPDPQGNS